MQLITGSVNMIDLLGYSGGTLAAISTLPQLVRTVKKKKASDVSPAMLIILICGIALWVAYGVFKKDVPLIVANTLSLILNLIMLFLYFKYKRSH